MTKLETSLVAYDMCWFRVREDKMWIKAYSEFVLAIQCDTSRFEVSNYEFDSILFVSIPHIKKKRI